jgi:hypothetical protein
MSNSNENVLARKLHGKFGDQLIFKTRNNKSFVSNVPKNYKKTPVGNQQGTRDNFRMATKWAKKVLANPSMEEAYRSKEGKGRTAFVVAITDYLKPPRIAEIDASDFSGRVGDKIRVVAFDEINVKQVTLTVTDPQGNVIEESTCVPDGDDMYWDFTLTVAIPTLNGIELTARAQDNPGHWGEVTVKF